LAGVAFDSLISMTMSLLEIKLSKQTYMYNWVGIALGPHRVNVTIPEIEKYSLTFTRVRMKSVIKLAL
jgi:hypothetical protein